MAFPNRALRTGTSAPQETPYLRAAQEWDRRIGDSRAQARNWRFFAFGMLGLTALLAGGLVKEANETHIKVFVVPVDQVGKPGRVELAGNRYQPTQAEISYFLATWVRDNFSESIDPVVFSQQIHKAYAFLAGNATTYVTQWAQKHDPAKDLGKRAISIDVSSVLPRSASTYQVNWVAKTYENGALTKTASYTGLFSVTVIAPTSSSEILRNPLGLYITDVSWTH
jgi:type IV secretory pathway TrbF-like protein